jgi:hypothetical protein
VKPLDKFLLVRVSLQNLPPLSSSTGHQVSRERDAAGDLVELERQRGCRGVLVAVEHAQPLDERRVFRRPAAGGRRAGAEPHRLDHLTRLAELAVREDLGLDGCPSAR